MKTKTPPWEKPAPRRSNHAALNTGQKAAARARAKRAGRSYPNLIDSMWASKHSKAGT